MIEVILKLEEVVDRLLARNAALQQECEGLRRETETLKDEQGRVRLEVDRILSKIEEHRVQESQS